MPSWTTSAAVEITSRDSERWMRKLTLAMLPHSPTARPSAPDIQAHPGIQEPPVLDYIMEIGYKIDKEAEGDGLGEGVWGGECRSNGGK